MILQKILDALIPAAQAHEKWFVPMTDVAPALPPAFVPGSRETVIAAIVIGIVSVAGFLLDKAFERSAFHARAEASLRRFRDIATGTLAVSVAIFLLWSAWHGVLLAENFPLPEGNAGIALRIVEAAVGGMLLIGIGTVSAAVGLGLLYAACFALFGFVEPLDYLYFAGIAAFLLFFARGRYSLDWFYGKPVLSSPEGRKRAYLVMRMLTGVGFLMLALGKWIRPDLHLALIDRYSDANPYVLLQWIGFSLTRETYVLCLAAVETTVAIFVFSGFLTRVAALGLMPIFTASMLFLGPAELVGHLPILGILVVLFVYGDTYHKGISTPTNSKTP